MTFTRGEVVLYETVDHCLPVSDNELNHTSISFFKKLVGRLASVIARLCHA